MLVGNKKVEHSQGSYDILLYKSFQGLKSELEKLPPFTSITILTERNIGQLYLKYVERELIGMGVPIHFIFIKGGEKNKHIDRVKKVYHQLIELGVDRKGILVALGGGVVGDFTGFIASTYQRGLRFVQIPTTLLASVDSSVGGKVAVNVNKGKNMVGSFHQPDLVFIPLFVLSTLPAKEWKCGLAEIGKHSLLNGGKMWEDYVSHSFPDIYPESEILVKMILDSVSFKAGVVSRDEKESGLRQILNLGHTTAHAIESYTKYKKYSHGEAVAIGILTAILLSIDHMGFPSEKITEIKDSFRRYELPYTDSISVNDLWAHMEHDKKKDGKQLKFVLLKEMGEPVFGIPLDKKDVTKAWKQQSQWKK